MRACCMGVLDDEGPDVPRKLPPAATEDQEKHTKDLHRNEKINRKRSDGSLKSWTVKRSKHTSEQTIEDTNKKTQRKLGRQQCECTQPLIKCPPRQASDDSSSDSRSPIKRNRVSPEKVLSTKSELAPRHEANTNPRPADGKLWRKISPVMRKLTYPQVKNWKHCRHVSEPGDVKCYRSDSMESGKPGLVRSASVKSGSPEGGTGGGTTLRCGCPLPQAIGDNRAAEPVLACASLAVRLRRQSQSPHPPPPARRGSVTMLLKIIA